MAVQKHGVWEVRPTGNDNNGGGFFPDVSGAGTDYSQQDAAQLTLTNLRNTTSANTYPATIVDDDVTGAFTTAMIGNTIGIEGEGHYVIMARIDANTIQVERTLSIHGISAFSARTGRVGGCMAHLSVATGSVGSAPSITTGLLVDVVLPGGDDTVWVKSGNYTDAEMDVGGGIYFGRSCVEGYTTTRGDGAPTRPVIKCAPDASAAYNFLNAGAGNAAFTFRNLIFDADNILPLVMFSGTDKASFKNCDFINGLLCAAELDNGHFEDCLFADSGSTGNDWTGDPTDFDYETCGVVVYDSGAKLLRCRITGNNGPGIYLDGGAISLIRVIVDHNQGPGVYQDYSQDTHHFHHCIFDNNGYDGILANAGSSSPTDNGIWDSLSIENCVFSDNGGYGINNQDSDMSGPNTDFFKNRFQGCAFYNNSDGDVNRIPDPPDKITLSVNPFVDSATGDYTPNETTGGGSLLRGAAV